MSLSHALLGLLAVTPRTGYRADQGVRRRPRPGYAWQGRRTRASTRSWCGWPSAAWSRGGATRRRRGSRTGHAVTDEAREELADVAATPPRQGARCATSWCADVPPRPAARPGRRREGAGADRREHRQGRRRAPEGARRAGPVRPGPGCSASSPRSTACATRYDAVAGLGAVGPSTARRAESRSDRRRHKERAEHDVAPAVGSVRPAGRRAATQHDARDAHPRPRPPPPPAHDHGPGGGATARRARAPPRRRPPGARARRGGRRPPAARTNAQEQHRDRVHRGQARHRGDHPEPAGRRSRALRRGHAVGRTPTAESTTTPTRPAGRRRGTT